MIKISLILNFFVIIFLIFVNAFYVLTEFALLSIRPSRIDELILKGNKSALLVKKSLNNLDEVMSAAQLGITISTISLGFIVDDTISLLFPSSSFSGIIFGIVIVLSFLLIISFQMILGELIPKSLALQYSEPIALQLARPTLWSTRLLRPMIVILNGSSWVFLKIFGLSQKRPSNYYSADELRLLFKKGVSSGIIEKKIEKILENTFNLGSIPIKEIVTHKSDIVMISVTEDLDYALELVSQHGFSRFPVYRDYPDNIVGVLNSKDIFNYLVEKELFYIPKKKEQFKSIKIDHLLREITIVPETMVSQRLLSLFKTKKSQLAVVVNEYGGVEGIVTLEDILNLLVGDLNDDYI